MTLEAWQSNVAHNLANAGTPGFKPSHFKVDGHEVQKVNRAQGVADPHAVFPLGGIIRSEQPGQIQITGNPYDLAIQGEGFFSVRGPEGQIMYTRDGGFHRNSEGVIVNKLGYPLLSEGAPIEILPDDGPFTVNRDGSISQDGQIVSQVSVYRMNNPSALPQNGGSYFVDVTGEAGIALMEDPTVHQGQLEMSAVSPIKEMVSMITLSRSFELAQKVIQEEDDRTGKMIDAFKTQ